MSDDAEHPSVRVAGRPRRPPSQRGIKAMVGAVIAVTVGAVVLLFFHLSGQGELRSGVAPAGAECAPGQGDCLPNVAYVDTNGVAYSRASLAGKIVLVNFWATWCKPCEREIPDLSRIYDKYRAKGVVFLGVLIDTPDNHQLLNFQSDHDMSYPVVRANRELLASYNYPDAYPTTFVYDRRGKQAFKQLGAVREQVLESLLSTLVTQN